VIFGPCLDIPVPYGGHGHGDCEDMLLFKCISR